MVDKVAVSCIVAIVLRVHVSRNASGSFGSMFLVNLGSPKKPRVWGQGTKSSTLQRQSLSYMYMHYHVVASMVST